MKPKAYVCLPRSGNLSRDMDRYGDYCRIIYESGYMPVCPSLVLPYFIDDDLPDGHRDNLDYSKNEIRHCKILILCDKILDETMKTELSAARTYGVPTTTLEGILSIHNYNLPENEKQFMQTDHPY